MDKICKTERCGRLTCKSGKKNVAGDDTFHTYCTACRKARRAKYPIYHIYKKDSCERCGFIPEHPQQLDVDHIDGDKFNGELDNLQTLCANCHRLKTALNEDSKKQ
jgi:5-methylcytosine-specific restriction endonuclease McrA